MRAANRVWVHRIALHEAGHIVACAAYGLPVYGVAISAVGGRVELNLDLGNLNSGSKLALQVQTSYIAGPATTQFLFPGASWEPCDGDTHAALMIGTPWGKTTDQLLTNLRSRAVALLRRHQFTLAALAWLLDVRSTMTSAEINFVLNSPGLMRTALLERDARNGLPKGTRAGPFHHHMPRFPSPAPIR
jgi:hypothetical protein